MTDTVELDPKSAAFVAAQLASGHYEAATDVVREALNLLESVERKRNALDESIMRGIADADAGRVYDLDDVFNSLMARYADPEA